MADSWNDVQGRTLINFLVSCPHGFYFLSSVDVTDTVEDAASIFKLLDEVVEEIGEGNVVQVVKLFIFVFLHFMFVYHLINHFLSCFFYLPSQVITKNTVSFKAAGKMLEEKRRNLFWTPCAVYCIDRMFEDILSIKWVGECLDRAKKITRLIYNSTWLLSFMKEFTKGQELLRPATTKFATIF